MNKKNCKHEDFFGTTTLGEKGQIVIPVEARQAMKLEKGDKLLVFGLHGEMLAFSKLSNLKKLAENLSGKLKVIHKAIGKSK
jgi:AbrB family looped-hinge helix DNA binding protein